MKFKTIIIILSFIIFTSADLLAQKVLKNILVLEPALQILKLDPRLLIPLHSYMKKEYAS